MGNRRLERAGSPAAPEGCDLSDGLSQVSYVFTQLSDDGGCLVGEVERPPGPGSDAPEAACPSSVEM